MIKILFFIEKLNGGGAEKVLRNLVNSMDQTKFDITVQTLWKYPAERFLAPGIKYKYCYRHPDRLTRLLFRLQAETGMVYTLFVKDDYDIEVAYLEAEATKVISSSTNKKSKKLAWVHCDLKKAKTDLEKFVRRNKRRYEKFDQVVCVSRTVQESFQALFGKTPASTILYNTILDEEIIHRSKMALPQIEKKKLTVVILGSLYYPKNIPRLLWATRHLLDDGFDFNLWILGDGADRPKIESSIIENDLCENVKMWGFQDNPYPFIAAADLLVCSSIYEGFSTFITEGLILGKPIVTTDCSGMVELLGNSEYGLITENSDQGFYEGMKRMIADEGLRKYYEEKAKLRGKAFSKAERIAETESFFHSVLKGKKKG